MLLVSECLCNWSRSCSVNVEFGVVIWSYCALANESCDVAFCCVEAGVVVGFICVLANVSNDVACFLSITYVYVTGSEIVV